MQFEVSFQTLDSPAAPAAPGRANLNLNFKFKLNDPSSESSSVISVSLEAGNARAPSRWMPPGHGHHCHDVLDCESAAAPGLDSGDHPSHDDH